MELHLQQKKRPAQNPLSKLTYVSSHLDSLLVPFYLICFTCVLASCLLIRMEDDKLITQKRKGRTKKDGIPLLFFPSAVLPSSSLFCFLEQSRVVSVHFLSSVRPPTGQASSLLFKPPDIGGTKILTMGSWVRALISSHLEFHPLGLPLSADLNTPNQISFMPSLLTLETRNINL